MVEIVACAPLCLEQSAGAAPPDLIDQFSPFASPWHPPTPGRNPQFRPRPTSFPSLTDGRNPAHEFDPEQFHSISLRYFFKRRRERLCGHLLQREVMVLPPIVIISIKSAPFSLNKRIKSIEESVWVRLRIISVKEMFLVQKVD
jgi:hypothetical protein